MPAVRSVSLWVWIDDKQDTNSYDYLLDARSPDWYTSRDGVGADKGQFLYKKFRVAPLWTLDINPGWSRVITHRFDASPPQQREKLTPSYRNKKIQPGMWRHIYLEATRHVPL